MPTTGALACLTWCSQIGSRFLVEAVVVGGAAGASFPVCAPARPARLPGGRRYFWAAASHSCVPAGNLEGARRNIHGSTRAAPQPPVIGSPQYSLLSIRTTAVNAAEERTDGRWILRHPIIDPVRAWALPRLAIAARTYLKSARAPSILNMGGQHIVHPAVQHPQSARAQARGPQRQVLPCNLA